MSQLEDDIQEVEITIKEAKKAVEYAVMVRRLIDNPDFKKLVTEDYFVEEAARLSHLYSEPGLTEDQVRWVQNDLLAIGGFKRFIKTKLLMGTNAQRELEHSNEVMEELRMEEMGGDSDE